MSTTSAVLVRSSVFGLLCLLLSTAVWAETITYRFSGEIKASHPVFDGKAVGETFYGSFSFSDVDNPDQDSSAIYARYNLDNFVIETTAVPVNDPLGSLWQALLSNRDQIQIDPLGSGLADLRMASAPGSVFGGSEALIDDSLTIPGTFSNAALFDDDYNLIGRVNEMAATPPTYTFVPDTAVNGLCGTSAGGSITPPASPIRYAGANNVGGTTKCEINSAGEMSFRADQQIAVHTFFLADFSGGLEIASFAIVNNTGGALSITTTAYSDDVWNPTVPIGDSQSNTLGNGTQIVYFERSGAKTVQIVLAAPATDVALLGWSEPELVNLPPTADAGPDQSIRAGDLVVLDASGSFDDNTPSAALVYYWQLYAPEGSSATLMDAGTVAPSFVADVVGTYYLDLFVFDAEGLYSYDWVLISSDNLAPTAVAGEDQLVVIGSGVVLDGSGSSDPENDLITYAWTITSAPAGSTAILSDSDAAQAGLTPDLEGVFEVTLEVSDFIGPGTPDAVEITATTAAGFAESKIVSVDEIVSLLDSDQITTAGNRNAMQNFLRQAIVGLQDGDETTAIDKLEKAISRTDGCVLRGAPDGNGPGRDWVTDCAAQAETYHLLNEALGAFSAP